MQQVAVKPLLQIQMQENGKRMTLAGFEPAIF